MICLKHLLIPIPRIIAEECALKKLSASLNLLKMPVVIANPRLLFITNFRGCCVKKL